MPFSIMAKEIDKVDDIEIPDEEDLAGLDDATDWKAKADELQRKHLEAGIRNRERTKALKDQIAKLTDKVVDASGRPPAVKTENKSDSFGLLEKTYLASVAKVMEPDEVELAEKGWLEYRKHGGTIEQYVSSKVFKIELEEHREKKANTAATTKIRGNAQPSTKDNVDAVAQDLISGNLDNLPKDRNLIAEAALKAAESMRGGSKTFYND